MKKYFSYKANFVFLVLLASFVSATAVLMKTSSTTEQSRQALIRSETIQKMNPFKRIVSFKIDEIKNQLVSFALARKKSNSNLNFGVFNSVALFESNAFAKWIESKDATLTAEIQKAALNSVDYKQIDSSGFGWFKYQDANTKPLYLAVFEIEASHKDVKRKAYLVGISLQNPLAAITDDYRGTSGKVYLVNNSAIVATHTNKNYDGTSFSADPIYQDLKSSKRAMSSGSFVDLSGDTIFAYYEKIEKSNLFAVISSPKLNATATKTLQASMPFMIGMLAFFGFIAFIFTQRLAGNSNSQTVEMKTEPVKVPVVEDDFKAQPEELTALKNELMKKGLSSINPFAQVAALPAPIVAPVTKAENGEKSLEFVKLITGGLSRIFSERISGIIAESSLILAKTSDPELTSHAKLIQTESRKSRDLIRELEQLNGEATQVLSAVNLSEVCEHALVKFRNEIDVQEIALIKDVDTQVSVMASIEKLQLAIEKIISNSIEALKGREDKSLSIKIARVSDRAELTISDNGVGMNKELQEKAFLPFYRGFSTSSGNGLGLSFVQGVVDTMKGEIQVQSSPGFGTEMKLSFDVKETPALKSVTLPKEKYEALKNPKLDLDFVGDISEASPTDVNYFELGESDLDQEFDDHLKRLSDKMIAKKKVEAPEFNTLKNFEDEDDDVDDFKVVIREPKTKNLGEKI